MQKALFRGSESCDSRPPVKHGDRQKTHVVGRLDAIVNQDAFNGRP